MVKNKLKICRLLGYESFDTELPQAWFNMIASELHEAGALEKTGSSHPWVHFVWLYRDKKQSYSFGVPGPITSFGRDLLKKLDERDDKLEPVSPSLSGMHE